MQHRSRRRNGVVGGRGGGKGREGGVVRRSLVPFVCRGHETNASSALARRVATKPTAPTGDPGKARSIKNKKLCPGPKGCLSTWFLHAATAQVPNYLGRYPSRPVRAHDPERPKGKKKDNKSAARFPRTSLTCTCTCTHVRARIHAGAPFFVLAPSPPPQGTVLAGETKGFPSRQDREPRRRRGGLGTGHGATVCACCAEVASAGALAGSVVCLCLHVHVLYLHAVRATVKRGSLVLLYHAPTAATLLDTART